MRIPRIQRGVAAALLWVTTIAAFAQSDKAEGPTPAPTDPSPVEASPELQRLLRDEKRRLEIGRLEAEMRRVIAKRAAQAAKRKTSEPAQPAADPPVGPAPPDRSPEKDARPAMSPEESRQLREERLEELFLRKDTLTPEEYQRKRIEILMEGVE